MAELKHQPNGTVVGTYGKSNLTPKGSILWRFPLILVTWPALLYRYRKIHREFDRKYPDGMTAEQSRRLRDLGDGYAEYADNDPRKYGIYDQGTSDYTPPHYIRIHNADERRYGFGSPDHLTREQFRQWVDLRLLMDYHDDDPRKYGIYGLGDRDYTPGPDDHADGRFIRYMPEGRVVDTHELTNDQFRRLIDLGDPEGEYREMDRRRFGDYSGLPDYRTAIDREIYVWRDDAVPGLGEIR